MTDPTGTVSNAFGWHCQVVGDAIAISSAFEGNGVVRLYRKQAGSWTLFQTPKTPGGRPEYGWVLVGCEDRLLVTRQNGQNEPEAFFYHVPAGGLAQLEGQQALPGLQSLIYIYTHVAVGERSGRFWLTWRDNSGAVWSSWIDAFNAPRFLQAEGVQQIRPATDGVLMTPMDPNPTNPGPSALQWQYLRVQPEASPGIPGSSFSTIGIPIASESTVLLPFTGVVGLAPMLSLAMGKSVCEGDLNSVGQRGALSALGCMSASTLTVSLALSQLPATANGILVESLAPFSPLPGSGTLCVGPPFLRVSPFQTSSNGRATIQTNELGGFPVGQTRTFIGWYRDGTSAFLTNSLSLTATP